MEDLILLRWQNSPNWSTGWVQPYHNSNCLFCRNDPEIHTEMQGILNIQNNIEKEQIWRICTSWFKNIIQSYSNQNSVILAQKQQNRSMEQDRKPRDKPMHLWPTNLWQRRQWYRVEKTVSLISGTGKTGQLYVKEWN